MSKLYPTPHINATPDDIAKTVLMPGDPLRAKFIAENFLENAVLFNNVRGKYTLIKIYPDGGYTHYFSLWNPQYHFSQSL